MPRSSSGSRSAAKSLEALHLAHINQFDQDTQVCPSNRLLVLTRSNRREAADHYRRAIDIVDAHLDGYDLECRAHYLAKISAGLGGQHTETARRRPTMTDAYVVSSP